MNRNEFHLAFMIGLDKVMTNQYPDYLPEEIDILLNNAIKQFVRNRFTGNNVFKTGVEGSEKRRDDLRLLTITTDLVNPSQSITSRTQFQFPSDYWFILRFAVGLTGNICGQEYTAIAGNYFLTDAIDTRLLDLDTRLKDPFFKPVQHKRVLVTFEDNAITVYSDNIRAGIINLSYIKEPPSITSAISGDYLGLPRHTHEEVVEIAINNVLETIESGRIQSHTPTKLQNIE
jgi:hypothetical protein